MIWVAVLSRDGRIQDDVLVRVGAAVGKTPGATMAVVKYPYGVAACRNKAVELFLRTTTAERLLFIDDDVLVTPTTIKELESVDADIVFGCYASLRYDTKGGFTKFISVERNGRWDETWFDGVTDCTGGGGGCMMIRRHVFDAVGFPWFHWLEARTENGIALHSEDCEFCSRALTLGLTVKANGNVRCGHLKTLDVSRLI